MAQLLLKPEKLRWYQSAKFKKSLKESLWVSASWNWFTTLVSTFGELVLTGSVLYTTALFVPGVSKPAPWIDVSVTLAQQLTLDVSGLVMVKQWLKLKKQGHEEQANHAKKTAICLISIMFSALVLSLTSSHYSYNPNLLVALEITLLVARGAAAILYGVMLLVIHFVDEDTEETPQVNAKVTMLETKITEMHQKLDALAAAPLPQVVPQVLIENHLQTAIMNGPLAELLAEIRTGHKTLADQIAEMKEESASPQQYAIAEVSQLPLAESASPQPQVRKSASGPQVAESASPQPQVRKSASGPQVADNTKDAPYTIPEISGDVSKAGFIVAILIKNNGLYNHSAILSAASARGLALSPSTRKDARTKYIKEYSAEYGPLRVLAESASDI